MGTNACPINSFKMKNKSIYLFFILKQSLNPVKVMTYLHHPQRESLDIAIKALHFFQGFFIVAKPLLCIRQFIRG